MAAIGNFFQFRYLFAAPVYGKLAARVEGASRWYTGQVGWLAADNEKLVFPGQVQAWYR